MAQRPPESMEWKVGVTLRGEYKGVMGQMDYSESCFEKWFHKSTHLLSFIELYNSPTPNLLYNNFKTSG